MEKQAVLEKLRAHEAELRAAGIVHLRLFGSVARGDNGAESDVDLLANLDPERKLTLIGVVGLENKLTDTLNAKVHLTIGGEHLRPRLMKNVERDAEIAF